MKIFDSHFHIIDKKFPLVENHGFLPDDFTVEQYRLQTKLLNICSGAIVSGSYQTFDQTYLLAALQQLGPGFVGVTQLPVSTTDNEILALNQAGVRAVRFNLKRGGSETLRHIEKLAQRVYALAQWHVELYVDSRELEDLYGLLLRLPKISIDHLGLYTAGFNSLLKLVAKGAMVKASGFGRGDLDIASAMQKIVTINPEALMFGTDLPCTRSARAFAQGDIDLIRSLFSTELQEKILYQNAEIFYRLNKQS